MRYLLTQLLVFNIGVSAILEILVNPTSQNISYGELGRFFCSVRVEEYSGILYWAMNGQPGIFSTNLAVEGYRREDTSSQNNIRSSTLYINGSFYRYNNLQVICGVSSQLSPVATLTILAPNTALNLSIQSRTNNGITIGWTSPPVIILQPGDANILHYEVIVSKLQLDVTRNFSLNGSVNEYNFKSSKRTDFCSELQFCIVPVRSVPGVEQARNCIKTSLHRAFAIDGPSNSSLILREGKYYVNSSCNVTCSFRPSLVVWMVNSKPLQSSLLNLSFMASNNYQESCYINRSSGEIERSIYREFLEIALTYSTSLNLSLAVVTYCEDLDEDCTSSVCFSQSTLLQFDVHDTDDLNISHVQLNADNENTSHVQMSPNNPNNSYVQLNQFLLGTSIVLAVIIAVVCVSCIIMMIFLKRSFTIKQIFIASFLATSSILRNQRPPLSVTRPDIVQEESFYDYCGDPTVKAEGLYDKPKTPSPQPNMQPCQAYSTLPVS